MSHAWRDTWGAAYLWALYALPAVAAPPPEPWLASVERRLAQEEYQLSQSLLVDGWTAPNRAHDLRTTWVDGALLVEPRIEGKAWRVRLETSAMGGANVVAPVGTPACEVVEGGRIEWERADGLREWYSNDRRGIKQGFFIERRPGGNDAGLTRIEMAVDGVSLVPAADGASVSLRDGAGTIVLRIGEIVVTDALERHLPACFEVSGPILAIVIDDSAADYPVVVDPLITSPAWRVEGRQYLEQFGMSAVTAGDVNADGYSDVVVGTGQFDNGAESVGVALAYLGSPSGLSVAPAWRIEGVSQSDMIGSSLATAGDVNGDGYSDVIVGARGYFDAGNTGRVFVYCGSPTGLLSSPVWSTDRPGVVIGRHFGSSVASAGDVNGDGFSDIIVGEIFGSDALVEQGGAFVFHGSPAGLAVAPGWTFLGRIEQELLGCSVSSAGDVNGDGYSDVIVGAPENNGNPSAGEGSALVFLGSPSGLSSAPAWEVHGGQAAERYGISVATAGDVNGDGYSDVVVGADQFDDAFQYEGRAELYLGGPSGLESVPAWGVRAGRPANFLGRSVACGGDINGDGFADVLVGVFNFSGPESSEGKIDVYHGSPAGLPPAPTTSVESGIFHAWLGNPVTTAGDVNGDGFSDVIAGAQMLPTPEEFAGGAFLFMGSPDGIATVAGWRAETDQAAGGLDLRAASAGDVNGDGFSDVVVGAPRYDAGGADAGRVLAYLGGADGLPTTPSWTFDGDQPGALLGSSVARAGDVDGDGFADVVIGVSGHDGGGLDEGRVLAFLGSAAGLVATPAWTIDGDQAGASLGACVASAGDVNGDGFADVVLGEPLRDGAGTDEGRARVYLGSPLGLVVTPAWQQASGQAGARFGASLASAGDVDRDGYSDVVVGAEGFTNGLANEGAAFLYRGSPSGLSASAAWTAEGEQANARFGSTVCGAGDIDGDGYSDVAIAAIAHDGGQVDEGRVALFRGSATGVSASSAWTAEGNQANADFGSAVASAGDVNGDGYSDLAIGASRFDAGQRDEGRSFVYLGSASGLAASPAWTTESDQVDAFSGSSVASAGDVNGDGYSDVLVGAPAWNGGANDEGRVSVFYGNGGDGLDRLPRQRRFDDAAPIDVLGLGDESNGFAVQARARSPYGRDEVRLEVEVKPLDVAFDGTGLLRSPYTDTGAPQAGGSFVDISVQQPSLAPASHHWRARLRGAFPHPWQTHWMSRAENASTEADLRVPPPVPLTCDAGPAQDAGCVGGTATLDGSASSGSAPLTYAWSSAAPEVLIVSPASAVTDVTVTGAGAFVVQLEVRDGVDVEICTTTVSAGDADAPVLNCDATLSAIPDAPGEASVVVTASAADDCDPAVLVTNDRTAAGADASDVYPCGDTVVTFEARDAAGHVVSCVTTVTVADVGPPAEISASAATPLRVAKDGAGIHVSFEDRGAPNELVSLYAGTIRPASSFVYDHAPVACKTTALPVGPGIAELLVPLEPSSSRYYLVSASNCGGESPRGFRWDGVEHSSLPTDCGPLP